MSRIASISLIMSFALVASSPAQAHFGAIPEALSVFVPSDPGSDAIGLEASFGLLMGDDTGVFQWLCHENIINIGAIVTPRYAMNSEGVILGTD